ncbi:DUF6125 family protein [Chloroflexota bacterium]
MDLKDYSGDFDPNMKLENFSKEALIQLVRAAAKLYGGMNQFWYHSVEKKLGRETANDIQHEVWVNSGASQAEVRNVCSAMNITGDDVPSYFKFFQCTPINAAMIDMEFEVLDKNHGVLTCTQCAPLLSFEAQKDIATQKHMCEVVEPHGFQIGATMFNPRMKTTPVKLPPRKSRREIACRWKFEIE